MKRVVLDHFQTVDPILFSVAQKIGPIEIPTSENYFLSLCREIVSQQLASKAAEAIFRRFLALFGDAEVTPEYILALSKESLRKTGMSWAKAEFIKDLAKKVHEEEISFQNINTSSDQEVIELVTKVKGIGPWTAEMFLMFSLGREDVFSLGDLGLKRAIHRLYRLKNPPTKKHMARISQKWSPYRTYACRILWESLTLPLP